MSKELTVVQIQQTIGQLEASINKIEAYLDNEEYKAYCDDISSCITSWKVILKQTKESPDYES